MQMQRMKCLFRSTACLLAHGFLLTASDQTKKAIMNIVKGILGEIRDLISDGKVIVLLARSGFCSLTKSRFATVQIRWLAIGLILLSGVHFAHAQSAQVSNATIAQRSKAILNEAATTTSGPGVAVMIARGNKIIFHSARGQANIELGVPLSPDHLFRIASITKIFVAALVIKLSETGELSLDDTLSRFLPDFPNAEKITIRQLLSHTAGVSDQIPVGSEQPGFSRRDVDTSTLVREIAKRPPLFAPGSNQAYSNAGYILLGAVIEKVTGKPWYTALEERLLKPLGLKNTTYGLAAKLLPRRVAGYTTATPDHLPANASFISMTTPASAGALVSTLDDLRRWMRYLIDGRIINKAVLEQMITPATLSRGESANPYGLGMYIWHIRGETMIGHTGQINGFASVLTYLPSCDITIIALGNDDNFDAQTFGRRLAAVALGNPYPSVKSVPISAADLKALSGQYRDRSEVRTILAKDGKLYSQRGGRNPSLLQMTRTGELHFVPDELTYMIPVRDSFGKVVRLDYFSYGEGPPRQLPRIDIQVH